MTTRTKIRAILLMGVLLAGCSGQVVGTVQVPDLLRAPGAIQVNVPPEVLQEAQRQFQLVDKDPAPDAVQAMFAKLGITVNVQVVNVVANNGGGGGDVSVDVDQAVTIVVPTNAAEVCGVPQETPTATTPCEVKEVQASSARNDWFATARMRDGNPSTAWGPRADDESPALTFTMGGCCTIAGMKLKLSPVGVVVDVERKTGDGAWERVVTGLVPRYRELHHVNLPPFTADQVRLKFRGAVDGTVLVCEADLMGVGCGSPAPSAAPTATPTATPSAAPSATPSAMPSASAVPSAEPSATPSAAPSSEVSATPSAEPSATPTATPTATAEPTATPSAEATATPTPAPTATATAVP